MLGHVVLGLESDSTLSLYAARWPLLSAATPACLNPILAASLGELYAPGMTTAATGDSRCSYAAAGNIDDSRADARGLAVAQWYGWHVGFALAGVGMFTACFHLFKRSPLSARRAVLIARAAGG